ncbi:winged helix-turn-helix transcriptional regulator [Phytomonospora endophytica]|uniref:DNA-binding HxlR family transcriptional regulator n=1 Tax=Phytomonospora endophytica TaxID=714109 RepID=A0A841FMD8_9ACTN|nr:helix-turn-helix domain-containing protein [Phytomonospora endophytica]MBB6034367.1 DNA-binding HxlR family transcriptional regulator [Phytomonospora endophytica]GIG66760.1 HxlR family transcriptional regulator [Phytomonospora endophytica]
MDAEPINDVFVADCPGRHVLDHVTSRWATLLIGALAEGPQRFYLLRDRIGGISEKMLSQTLRVLARDGLVAREVEPDSPPKVTYRLTPLGEELAAHLSGLIGWIAASTDDIITAQGRYDAAKSRS